MRKLIFISSFFFVFISNVFGDFFDSRISISNVDFKIIKETSQFIHISVKADAYCQVNGDAYFVIQGIDIQGFEIVNRTFGGYCDANRLTPLTGATMIEPQVLKAVKEWRIKGINLYPKVR
ncbi:MAG: hypothetical protein HY787_18760 [Deltaproteobacteria bacterium]|nr:hypothetical protein [Deltaproteobacteria bacterium]